jgi:hypothetical protein
MQTQTVNCRLYFGDRVHKTKISTTLTFDEFITHVCSVIKSSIIDFYLENKNNILSKRLIRFKYQDEEQEWVTFDSEEEWQQAKSSAQKNIIRVQVLVNKPLLQRSVSPRPPSPMVEQYSARFIKDLTFPDGTSVPASTRFEKKWTIQNSGTNQWPAGVKLTSLQVEDKLVYDITPPQPGPGEHVTVSVRVVVPQHNGTRLRSYYQLQTADGVLFGPRMWLDVNIV